MLDGILLGLGGQLIGKLIGRKFGAEFGDLAAQAIDALGQAFGVDNPRDNQDKLAEEITKAPAARARGAVQEVEAMMADAILARVELQKAENAELALVNEQLEAEKKGPWFGWAWRPFWMWLLAVFWFWNIIGLHALNALFRIALPVTDLQALLWLTAAYLGLYMGGHTIKDGIAKWTGRVGS